MIKTTKALTALRETKSRVPEIAAYSGLNESQVRDLAKAHGVSLAGRG